MVIRFFGIRRIVVLAAILWGGYVAVSLLNPAIILNPLGYSRALYSRDNKLLRLTLSPDEKYRLFLPLADISYSVVQATLEKEDKYFFSHYGVNPISLVRGALRTVLTGRAVGGSTITMQVARLRFDLRTRSILGKFQQICAALLLELSFSKKEILETYLNLAPYGGNIEGVGAASLIYFNQPASSVSMPQASLLVSIPKNPSVRGKVFNGDMPARDLARNLVSADAKRLLNTLAPNAEGSSATILPKKPLPFFAPHFVNRVLSQSPPTGRVRTTLDLSLQQSLESFLSGFIDRNKSKGVRNGSILLVDYTSMEVKGYVGSADFFDVTTAGQVNGLTAKRSPGSSLKPFIYALAADKGYIHSQSVLFDTAVSKSNYNPENFEKNFIGPISATQALIHSRNIPAITLLNQIGPQFFRDFLIRGGISKVREPSFYGLSLALGGVEVSAEELARLYAMLASGGILKPLEFFVDENPDRDRSANESTNTDESEPHLLSSDAAMLLLRMLSENPRPESLTKDITTPTTPIPWKTGTSFGFRDAWATAIVGKYVLVVWLGNFDGSGNPIFVGRSLAGQLLFSVIDGLHHEIDSQPLWYTRSTSLKHVEVCATSGMLPETFCPHRSSALYIPGVSPIQKCNVHRQVLDHGKLRVTEVWNSDILKLFSDAGMPRKMDENDNGSKTAAPLITSPQGSLTYILSSTQETVPLRAVTDGQSHSHIWFINDEPVAMLPSGETYFWTAKEGTFVARVVDELGKSNSVSFAVERR